MATNDPGGITPPYGPWRTFANFIRGLNNTVIPPVIDSTLLSNLSGSAQSELRGALRFFSLVEGESDRVTDLLRELVVASRNQEDWRDHLAVLVPTAYDGIVNDVDLQAATRGQLEEAFREKGKVSGSVLQKAVRFFLSAMAEAGVQLSPHFGGMPSSGSSSRDNGAPRKTVSRIARQKKLNGNGGSDAEEKPAPPGTEKVTCSIPGGRNVVVTLPSDLTPAEQDFLVFYLQGYFKLGRGAPAE